MNHSRLAVLALMSALQGADMPVRSSPPKRRIRKKAEPYNRSQEQSRRRKQAENNKAKS